MRLPWTWWLAWGLFALFIAMMVATVTLDASTTEGSGVEESFVSDLAIVAAFGAFALVGGLVASRQPGNAVGWLFLASPLLAVTGAFAQEYAYRALVAEPGEWPAGLLFGWLYLWTWFPAVGAIALVPLLFPDGRPPGRRWYPVLWASLTLLVLGTIGAGIYPGVLDEAWPNSLVNPLGIAGAKGLLDAMAWIAGVFVFPLAIAILASVVVRFRRSQGDQRQQLKWMLVAAAILVADVTITEALPIVVPDAVSNVLFAAAIASIPVAAGIAMLKYRLYDVDVVIRKTLVYAVLSAVLAATYLGVVVGVESLLRPVTEGSDLAIAVSTLVVAALFLPARSWVRGFVDRRFYRRRYDAQRTLEAFSARLRQQVDLDVLRADLQGAVAQTVQPAHVSLWLRQERLAP